jgi:signal transduction histidine kinase
MINSVIQITLLDAHCILPEHHLVDVRDLLDDVKSEYDLQLKETALSLTWNYPAGPMQITTDVAKLKQILQNLINNAVKFTDQGSVTVSAGTRADGQKVAFKVTDTGIGIPKNMQKTIFEKLYQRDSSNTRLYSGVGLGLYTVKKLTELLRGTVELESDPGKGSTFTVTIPLQSSAEHELSFRCDASPVAL